jgi:hypothetical protein
VIGRGEKCISKERVVGGGGIILKKREVGKVATYYIGECDYTRD